LLKELTVGKFASIFSVSCAHTYSLVGVSASPSLTACLSVMCKVMAMRDEKETMVPGPYEM
jgi:hypothetical protein